MAETAILTEGLTKRFGSTRALDGLDLEVRTGEVHGFLGPNGAGKTTTLRVLLGLLRADAGTVTCWAATPGATRSACTAAWPMSPGTSPCGPTCPAAR
jgi:ABC-2 type transport system ATP-binding protein